MAKTARSLLVAATFVTWAIPGCNLEEVEPLPPAAPEVVAPSALAPLKVGDELTVSVASPAVSAATLLSSMQSSSVWTIDLHYPGASYICPHFDHFDLPPGASLVVRSPDGKQSYSYTGKGKEHPTVAGRNIWTAHIYGDTAVLELYSSVAVPAGALHVDRFVHGFPDLSVESGVEAICGTDERREAKCYQASEPTLYNRSQAVVRLLVEGASRCTGWLLGSAGHVMTNHHCIEDSAQAANTNYEFNAEGATCATDCRSPGACPGTMEATSATFVKGKRLYDYALVKLPQNVSTKYGFLRMRQAGARVGERIYIPQHPHRWGRQIAVQSDRNASGYCEVDSTTRTACKSPDGATYKDVGYYCDTSNGSSGSPVIAYSDHAVVALHACGTCTNRGVPVQEIIQDLGADLPPNAR